MLILISSFDRLPPELSFFKYNFIPFFRLCQYL